MQKAPHPNKLKMLLAVAGLSQRETAREAGIPEGHYAIMLLGSGHSPARSREAGTGDWV